MSSDANQGAVGTPIVWILPSLTLGMILVFLMPPFQAPDETAHFFRAYQLSRGQFIGVKPGERAGGFLPTPVIEDALSFSHLPFKKDVKTSRAEVTKRIAESRPMSGYSDSDFQFANFSNTVYPPVPYIPQVAGIWVGRALGLSTLVTAYLVRLLNLFTAAALCYLALKELRFSGRMFHFAFLLISMPMTVSLFASANSDAVTIALAFLVFGLAMSVRQEFTLKKFHWVLAGTALLSLSKSMYFFIPLILLPSGMFNIGNRPERWTRLGQLLVCAFIPALLWGVAVKHLYSPALPSIDPGEQWKYFLSHQPKTTLLLLQPYIEHPLFFARSFIGQLGWLDTTLPKTAFAIYGVLLVACLVMVPRDAREKPVSRSERGVAWMILVAVCLLFSLAMYLTWNAVGATKVEGLQGRYFILMAPLLLLAIPVLIRLDARNWKYWQGLMIALCVIAAALVPRAIYLRYWA